MSQKVLVIGAARSGLAGAEFLAKTGNQVVLTDMKQCNDIAELEKLGVSFIWGEQPNVAQIQPDYIQFQKTIFHLDSSDGLHHL